MVSNGDPKLVQRESPDRWVPMKNAPRDEGWICTLISSELTGSTDLGAGLCRMKPGEYHLKHHHPNGGEFYVFTKGRAVVHIDGDDIEAMPGTAIYIPAGAVHSIRNDSDEDAELVWGLSSPDYADIGFVFDE